MSKEDTKTMSILAHVLGIFTGFIGPLIIYLVTTDKTAKIHAKNALNWQVSVIIYWIISFILMIVLIGFLLIWILIILDIVFCILAAVNASKDKVWNYPLSFKFIK
jgi:uncharacterized Tic20 family protein